MPEYNKVNKYLYKVTASNWGEREEVRPYTFEVKTIVEVTYYISDKPLELADICKRHSGHKIEIASISGCYIYDVTVEEFKDAK